MALIVPDGLLRAAGMSEAEFKRELAIWLFQQERGTLFFARGRLERGRKGVPKVLGDQSSLHAW